MDLNNSPVEMEDNEQTKNYFSLCLICGSEKCSQISDDDSGGGSGAISKQLNVIYILKHLLQVPGPKLQQFLKKCGNPENWISLCDNCTKLTNNAREYRLLIVEIEKNEKKLQKEIIDKVKCSLASSSLLKLIKPKNNKEQFNIWKDTRKFVESYNYENIWDDPHLQGNQLIKNLEAQTPLRNSTPNKLITEVAPPQVKIEAQSIADSASLFPFPSSPFSSGDTPSFDDDWLPSPSPLPFQDPEPLVNLKTDIEITPTITPAPTVTTSQPPIKRGRGRPRKIKTENAITPASPVPPKAPKLPTATTSTTTFSKSGRPLKITTKVIIDDDQDDNDEDEWVPSVAEPIDGSESEEEHDPEDNEDEDNPVTSSSTGNRELKQCPHCPLTFKATAPLFHHMTDTHDIHQFPCGLPGCKSKLKNVKQYLCHRRTVHKPGGRSSTPKALKRLSRNQKRILRRDLKLPPVPLDTTPTPCHLCGITLPLCDLNPHLIMHKDTELQLAALDGATTTNGTYKCPVTGCKIEYSTKKGYQKHLQDKHGGSAENPIRQFSCSFCPKEFCHRRKWEEHEETHKNAESKPYKCEICGKGFSVPKYLEHHVYYTHTNKRSKCTGPDGADGRSKETFHCPKCTAVYPFYTHVFHHLKNDHNLEMVPCLVTGCLRSFETVRQFVKHRWRHQTMKNDSVYYEAQKYHQCIYCDSKFLFPASLMKHLKEEHGMDRMPCLEKGCLRTFGTIKQFHKHKTYCQFKEGATVTVTEKNKKEKGPRVLCETCGASCSSKEGLRKHMAHVHEGKKRVYGKGTTCHLCGAMVHVGHFKKHMRKQHKEVKEYQKETFKCGVVGCRMEYVRKELFEKHMLERHGGEDGRRKPFSCEFCGKGFCHRKKLKQHELIHRNEGNPSFLCGECGKGFITKRYLQYHRKYTHEGMKRGVKKRGGERDGGRVEFGEMKNVGDDGVVSGVSV